VGFGAVYTLALCFAVVLSNLGQVMSPPRCRANMAHIRQCVRERERERESVCVCVSVCVRERGIESKACSDSVSSCYKKRARIS